MYSRALRLGLRLVALAPRFPSCDLIGAHRALRAPRTCDVLVRAGRIMITLPLSSARKTRHQRRRLFLEPAVLGVARHGLIVVAYGHAVAHESAGPVVRDSRSCRRGCRRVRHHMDTCDGYGWNAHQ